MEESTTSIKPVSEPNVEQSTGPSIIDDFGQFLRGDMSFRALLLVYMAPYMVYTLLSSIPGTLLEGQGGQAIKLVLTLGVLIWLRRHYRFGVFKPGQVAVALMALPAALLCWIGPFYLQSATGIVDIAAVGGAKDFTASYYCLRLINSVFLVAVFEELFVRVYVMGWLYQAGLQRSGKTIYSSIMDTLDQCPRAVSSPPLSAFSVPGATIVFAVGHRVHEFPSAVLYFLFTTWVYRETGSLWVCILIHGLSNLVIALLVGYGGMEWLW